MVNQVRRRILFYLTLVFIGTFILAASLSTMQLQPGTPIPGADSTQNTGGDEIVTGLPKINTRQLLQIPLVLIFAALVIATIISLVKKIKVKHIHLLASGLLLVLCLFLLLNQIEFAPPAISSGESQSIVTTPSASFDIAPIGEPPEFLFQIVVIIAFVGFAVIFSLLLSQIIRRAQQAQKSDLLAEEAGQALKDIQDGKDLGNVIIRCYLQMEKIIQDEQGIEREESLTPREFERLLSAKGIAPLHIHQLTRLFEKARYGRKTLTSEDEQNAIHCLSVIRSTCELERERQR